MIPTITLYDGEITEGQNARFKNPEFALQINGNTLTAMELNKLVMALVPFLTAQDANALHRKLAEGLDCQGSGCPCYVMGVQDGKGGQQMSYGKLHCSVCREHVDRVWEHGGQYYCTACLDKHEAIELEQKRRRDKANA